MRKTTERGLLAAFAILVLVGLRLLFGGDASAQQAPVLLNPSFEGEFRNVGAGEVTIAEGWQPWWDETGSKHRPEWKPELATVGSGRVSDGDKAQKQFTTFSQQDGGVFQRVAVQPGQWYRFSCRAYVWSSSGDDPNESQNPTGKLAALVGINPWGDTNALARTTVWGRENDLSEKPWRVYDRWIELEVIAQAWGSHITVFTRAEAVNPVKHNDTYWDACSLERYEVGSPPPCPTPGPCPTVSPLPQDCPSADEIRTIVHDELLQREPVRYPR